MGDFVEKWAFLKQSNETTGQGWRDQAIFFAILAGFDPFKDSQETMVNFLHRAMGHGQDIRDHVATMPNRRWNSWEYAVADFILHCAANSGCNKKDIVSNYIRKQSNCAHI